MKYHFIGIKGSGMSSLACIMHDLGNEVQGSDKTYYLFAQAALEERKIKMLPFCATNITKEMIVVIGNAFRDDHPEVIRAKELGVKTYRYFELLGALTKEHKTIAISGCHGKTTTTSLLSHVFNNLIGCNYLIGDGTGYAKPGNQYFLIEACEYKRHFLYYYPQYTIITNIDLDHTDYYKDIEDMKQAYLEFGNRTKELIIACGDDELIRSVDFKPPVIYYGFQDHNDIVARNVELTASGSSFDIYAKAKHLGHFDLPLYGKHMILNALSVITMAYYKELDLEKVKTLFKSFRGAKRRFKERIIKDIVTIDDYAHHPLEIKVTIEAARQKYPTKKIVAIYLPNTYSRMQQMYKEFAVSLNLADQVYIMDIKSDREKQEEWEGVSSDLVLALLNNGEKVSKEDVAKLLVHKNSVLIFMSCTEIYHLQAKYEELLKERN